ncbi:MAG: hypothetical protein QF911_00300 [Candidatus Thalassarchaeaceae archaeon]|jgi:hypothetical protein|nr:hypothetical protein [Candidatus Thalassarchaeaceae archaeon]
MGLKDRLTRWGEEEADHQTAQVILETIGDRAYHLITPTRVLFASLSAFLIASATLFALVWVIPYQNVNLDVAYMQSASGHVVLAELDNKGSRPIEDVSVTMRLLDIEGVELGRHDFTMEKLPAHSSISNTPSDDLEMVVLGQSVWESYTIEITLDYRYYGGEVSERWTHEVGDWSREFFVEEVTPTIF